MNREQTMENNGLNKFVAIWERDGFSEERIARLTAHYLRHDNDDDAASPPQEEETETAPETAELDEPPCGVDPEVQAAIAAGMQIMVDPGIELRQTRAVPQLLHPRVGRKAIDINDPNMRRMLERYRPLSLHEIAQQKPPQWLIARYIPEASLVELFGEFASCKSFLALDWAFCIAAGKPWLGRKVQQGHVVYIYAEGTQGLRKRGLAWCKENGLDDFPEGFHAIPRPIDMRDPEALDHIALAIKLALPKGKKPSLIVIDTLNRCFGGGDENSTQDMSGFINGCDALREEFGATVLIVHHSGKDRMKGSRGASALGGAMDVIFELVKARRDQPLATLRNNTNTTKPHKDSSPLPDLALDFAEIELDIPAAEDDPHANTSLVVRLANAEAVAAARGAKKRTAADETLAVIRSFKDGVTLPDLVEAIGKPRSTIRSHRDKLLRDGRIRQEGELLIAEDTEEAGMSPLEEVEALLKEEDRRRTRRSKAAEKKGPVQP
jgi:hypothetical protein